MVGIPNRKTRNAPDYEEKGPIGSGDVLPVKIGQSACVVIDQIRFGKTDLEPYWNPQQAGTP